MPATEPLLYDQANGAQRFVRRFASSGPGSWMFARVAHRLDKPIYRMTDGRRSMTSILAGLPMLMLTTTGAKSGKPRTVPVLGIPTDDGVAIIASNFGQERHPAWHYNLAKDPLADVEMDERAWSVRAVEAEGELRQRVWARALEIYPGYSTYETRADHRRIHVYVLQPRES